MSAVEQYWDAFEASLIKSIEMKILNIVSVLAAFTFASAAHADRIFLLQTTGADPQNVYIYTETLIETTDHLSAVIGFEKPKMMLREGVKLKDCIARHGTMSTYSDARMEWVKVLRWDASGHTSADRVAIVICAVDFVARSKKASGDTSPVTNQDFKNYVREKTQPSISP